MADRLTLDRVELADIAAPAAMAAAIHRQLGGLTGAVPVDEIAFALDIYQVRQVRLDGCEGVLLTDRRRNYGKIVVNNDGGRAAPASASHTSCGHFLLEHHGLEGERGLAVTERTCSSGEGDPSSEAGTRGQ